MEKIGLQAVFDDSQFGAGVNRYLSGLKKISSGFTDIKSMLSIGISIFNRVTDAITAPVNQFVEYSRAVKDLSLVTGIGIEATSRLIQVADDLTISQDTLTMSLRYAVDKGYAVNIDALAQMADEYVAIQDPIAKANYALDRFGARAGVQMAKLLEQGGDAIKDMYNNVEAGMVVTEEAAAGAREYEIAMDNLNDTMQSIQYSIGKVLLPALTTLLDGFRAVINVVNDAAGALDNLIDGDQKIAAEWERSNRIFAGTIDNYEDYIAYSEEWRQSVIKSGAAVWDLTDDLKNLTREEWAVARAVALANDNIYEANDAFSGAAQRVEQYGDALSNIPDKSAEATEALKRATDEYHTLLAGKWTKEVETYAGKMGELNTRKAALIEKMTILNNIPEKTQEQMQQLADYRTELDNIDAQMDEVTTAHDLARKQIVLGWMEMTLAADGYLDATDVEILMAKAQEWGIISQAEIQALREAQAYANFLRSDLYRSALRNAPSAANIGDISYGGAYGMGGSFIARRPTMITVGDRGAEAVNIMPLHGNPQPLPAPRLPGISPLPPNVINNRSSNVTIANVYMTAPMTQAAFNTLLNNYAGGV